MPQRKSAISAILLLALTSFGSAQTLWTGQTGDWFDPANWSDGVPDSSRDAQINNSGTAQILTGMANANSVGLGGGPLETDTGTLIVMGPGSLRVETGLSLSNLGIGTLMVLNGGVLSSQSGGISGSTRFGGSPALAIVDGPGSSWVTTLGLGVTGSLGIQNGGTAVSDTGTIDGSIVIDGPGSSWTTGRINITGSPSGVLVVRNGGLLISDDLTSIGDDPAGVASVVVDGPGSRWENDFDQAQIDLDFGFASTLSITNGGIVSTFAVAVGTNDGSNGSLTVDGTNSALNVRTNLSIGGEPGAVGVVQISNGGVINSPAIAIYNPGTLIADGVLTSQDTSINEGGSLSGNGTITGDVTNAGHVRPGDSIGVLGIGGSFAQSSTGVLTTEIGGPDSDAHDYLSVGSDAMFDGDLEVRFVDGFLPTAGQVFDLVGISGAVSGSFAQVTFPDLRSGFQFSGEFVNGVYQLSALNDGAPAIGLRNISTRGQVALGDDALIAGFIVTGSQDKQVIIRGLGPSLATNGVPLPGRLADPTLELHDNTGRQISYNDNWMESPDRQQIIDSTIPPTDDNEAAIVATLTPGNYTAILRGAGDGSGIGIVEVYDLSPDVDGTLANISTRGFVGTGDDVMIGGFIADDQDTRVLLRALGPSLALNGVENVLSDPALELHNNNGDTIASNNDWQDTDAVNIQNTGIPPNYPAESALIATLSPGNFTAIVHGQDAGTGVGLLEIYNLR